MEIAILCSWGRLGLGLWVPADVCAQQWVCLLLSRDVKARGSLGGDMGMTRSSPHSLHAVPFQCCFQVCPDLQGQVELLPASLLLVSSLRDPDFPGDR